MKLNTAGFYQDFEEWYLIGYCAADNTILLFEIMNYYFQTTISKQLDSKNDFNY